MRISYILSSNPLMKSNLQYCKSWRLNPDKGHFIFIKTAAWINPIISTVMNCQFPAGRGHIWPSRRRLWNVGSNRQGAVVKQVEVYSYTSPSPLVSSPKRRTEWRAEPAFSCSRRSRSWRRRWTATWTGSAKQVWVRQSHLLSLRKPRWSKYICCCSNMKEIIRKHLTRISWEIL